MFRKLLEKIFGLNVGSYSPSAVSYSSVTATYAGATATGSQAIAHQLGIVPKKVRITAFKQNGTTTGFNQSVGSWSSLNQSFGSVSSFSAGNGFSDNGGNIIFIFDSTTAGQQATVASVDATNINLNWTKTGAPSNDTIFLLVETEG